MVLVIASVVLLLAATAPPTETPTVASPAACAVVMPAMARVMDAPPKPLVFSDRPFRTAPGWSEEGVLALRWEQDPPSRDLAHRFALTTPSNAVVECPEVRAWLVQQGATIGHPSFEELTGYRLGGKTIKSTFDVIVETFTTPVLNAAGDEALMDTAYECGLTCAGSFLVHLRKDADGRWVATDSISGPIG